MSAQMGEEMGDLRQQEAHRRATPHTFEVSQDQASQDIQNMRPLPPPSLHTNDIMALHGISDSFHPFPNQGHGK